MLMKRLSEIQPSDRLLVLSVYKYWVRHRVGFCLPEVKTAVTPELRFVWGAVLIELLLSSMPAVVVGGAESVLPVYPKKIHFS